MMAKKRWVSGKHLILSHRTFLGKLAETGLVEELLSSEELTRRKIAAESCKRAYLTREEVTSEYAQGCILGLV